MEQLEQANVVFDILHPEGDPHGAAAFFAETGIDWDDSRQVESFLEGALRVYEEARPEVER